MNILFTRFPDLNSISEYSFSFVNTTYKKIIAIVVAVLSCLTLVYLIVRSCRNIKAIPDESKKEIQLETLKSDHVKSDKVIESEAEQKVEHTEEKVEQKEEKIEHTEVKAPDEQVQKAPEEIQFDKILDDRAINQELTPPVSEKVVDPDPNQGDLKQEEVIASPANESPQPVIKIDDEITKEDLKQEQIRTALVEKQIQQIIKQNPNHYQLDIEVKSLDQSVASILQNASLYLQRVEKAQPKTSSKSKKAWKRQEKDFIKAFNTYVQTFYSHCSKHTFGRRNAVFLAKHTTKLQMDEYRNFVLLVRELFKLNIHLENFEKKIVKNDEFDKGTFANDRRKRLSEENLQFEQLLNEKTPSSPKQELPSTQKSHILLFALQNLRNDIEAFTRYQKAIDQNKEGDLSRASLLYDFKMRLMDCLTSTSQYRNNMIEPIQFQVDGNDKQILEMLLSGKKPDDANTLIPLTIPFIKEINFRYLCLQCLYQFHTILKDNGAFDAKK